MKQSLFFAIFVSLIKHNTMRIRLITAFLLFPALVFSQNRVQNYINRQLKTDSLFVNAAVAILAVDENGKEIAYWNG